MAQQYAKSRTKLVQKRSAVMIISASRRTDIPSYYSEWFFNRIKAGYVYVRNPMNVHQISEVPLSPDVVDGIVFWTKNPKPMLGRLEELRDYTYYFQFTLNPYGTDIEKFVPSKNKVIIPTFQKLSSVIGKERVIWRYDPILINEKYDLQYHIKYFQLLCDKLADYTENCTVSFIDSYKNIKSSLLFCGISELSKGQTEELMGSFSETAEKYNISVNTCAESIDLSKFGITHASCVDKNRFERINRIRLDIPQDNNQRAECLCHKSIDIGAYNTCKNGCIYCYANYNDTFVNRNSKKHNTNSPLLFGEVSPFDIIKHKAVSSDRINQMDLFEKTGKCGKND